MIIFLTLIILKDNSWYAIERNYYLTKETQLFTYIFKQAKTYHRTTDESLFRSVLKKIE